MTGGSFNFSTLVCELFKHDQMRPWSTQEECDPLIFTMWKEEIARQAPRKTDVLPMRNPRKDGQMDDLISILFHERYHYWQLLSSTFVQLQFISQLEILRREIDHLKGHSHYVCSFLVNDLVLDDRLFDQSWSWTAHFERVHVTPQMIVGSKELCDDPSTEILELCLPHGRSASTYVKAFGARLCSSLGEAPYVFPFNGRYLLESSAAVAQSLFTKHPFPALDCPKSRIDIVYSGVWELWYRLHRQRYRTETELALAFLAAVDLAMSTDAANSDLEEANRYGDAIPALSSIPYRFGLIVLKSLEIPPLSLSDDNPAQAANRLQESLSLACGWTSPSDCAKKMAEYLTLILVQACRQEIWRDSATVKRVKNLVAPLIDEPYSNTAERLNNLRALWEIFANVRSRGVYLLGKSTLGMMLNACVFRMTDPGKFAAGSFYAHELANRFALPFVLMNDNLYWDHGGSIFEVNTPFPVSAIAVSQDCVGLLVLEPVRKGKTTCGFLENSIECTYVQSGLGCPQQGFHDQQKMERLALNIGSSCFRTFRTEWLDIEDHTSGRAVPDDGRGNMNTYLAEHRDRLRAEIKEDRPIQALDAFRVIVECETNWAQYHFTILAELVDEGHGMVLKSAFEDALRGDSDSAIWWYGYGLVLQMIDEVQGAVQAYRNGIKLNPMFGSLYYNLGNALHRLGQLNAAMEQYLEATTSDPTLAEPHYGLMAIWLRRGELVKAMRHLRAFIKLAPEYLQNTDYYRQAQSQLEVLEK